VDLDTPNTPRARSASRRIARNRLAAPSINSSGTRNQAVAAEIQSGRPACDAISVTDGLGQTKTKMLEFFARRG